MPIHQLASPSSNRLDELAPALGHQRKEYATFLAYDASEFGTLLLRLLRIASIATKSRKGSSLIHRQVSMTNKTKSKSSNPSVDLKILEIHSEYCSVLWDYYLQECGGVVSRDEIETKALRLAQRIYSSISVQFKTLGFDSNRQVPMVCQFTCIKAYAQALIADSFSFIRYLSILKEFESKTSAVRHPDSLFFDNLQANCYNERSSDSPAAGEFSFELSTRSNSDTLEEACVTSALQITYALWCAPDVHYITRGLDVLEHYYNESEHPLGCEE